MTVCNPHFDVPFQVGQNIWLAEVMLCRCIPAVTNCGAIPEVVGHTGCYVKYGDIEGTAKARKKALKDKSDKVEKARERAKEIYIRGKGKKIAKSN